MNIYCCQPSDNTKSYTLNIIKIIRNWKVQLKKTKEFKYCRKKLISNKVIILIKYKLLKVHIFYNTVN